MSYSIVLSIHSILRWVVIILGVLVLVRAWSGFLQRKPWTGSDNSLGSFFTISLDIQLLLGLILYFFLSPQTTVALQDLGGAMANPIQRFFAVEHLALMLIGLVLAHIGRSRSRKASDARAKHRNAAIFYTLALVLILVAIPWPFMSAGRPLIRLGSLFLLGWV